MNYTALRILGPILIGCLAWTAGATAAEKAPAPVLSAFQKAYPHAKLKGTSAEKRDGKLVYEVESMDNGRSRDLIYTAHGELVEMEEEIPLAEVPPAVSSAVAHHFAGAKPRKAERITRGTTTEYEMTLSGAAKKEVVLTSDGKVLSAK